MKKILESEAIPILLWLDDLEAEAMRQARNLANLPFAFHHVAIMPDAHLGYGMPIGGVLAAQGVVVPNAVGVDIGCGMCAVRSAIPSVTEKELKEVLSHIRATIPLGFKHQKRGLDLERILPLPARDQAELPVVRQEFERARRQLGTLGGGNHFIEIQAGTDGHVWLMVHSGSRNLGYQVAKAYNRLAAGLNQAQGSQVPAQWQLAYLALDSVEGRRYRAEMEYCVDFARANRSEMMKRIKDAFQRATGCTVYADPIDVAHNYAALELHYGCEVMVHRKGATRAGAGETGIIPGSQGTASYIVCGLGNPLSFSSCAHGAGRVLGRKQAQRQLDLATEVARLDRRGVIHALRRRSDLDEAPGAYKNIEDVMRNQEDLVEIQVRLSPLAVIKA